MQLTFYFMTFALTYEHVSAVEGAPDGSSHWTLTFEVEIKGPLEVTIELHLKMHMVVHLLVQQSSQNNSMKRELGEALYVALEGASKTSLLEAQKLQKLWKKKMPLTLQSRVHLTMQWRIQLWISNLTLCTSFISYIEQNKLNCWHFQIRFHKVCMRVKEREGRSGQKCNLLF